MKFFFKLLNFLLLFSISNFVKGQNNFYNKENVITVVSYNVENLFDTIDNPVTDDNEFLPGSPKAWNTEKYNKKINDLARVISSINSNELPEIVGLVEIENHLVLEDLVKNKLVKSGNYSIVHEDSPDARGIDVALIYRKDEFHYLNHEKILVKYDFEPKTTTRDILYVKGSLNNNEILHLFINHWSSRRDGMEVSEPKRIYTAGLLRSRVDSIQKKEKNSKIIIMGDFNDEPTNKSIREVLLAANSQQFKNYRELYNLMYDKHLLKLGTYNYKGNWNMLDNLIISKSLLHSPGKYEISIDGGIIFWQRWMMYDNVKTGDMTPNRTYGGPYYYGGVSDHLPVYLMLKK